MTNARLWSTINFKSFDWVGRHSNLVGSNHMLYQNRKRTLNSLSHVTWQYSVLGRKHTKTGSEGVRDGGNALNTKEEKWRYQGVWKGNGGQCDCEGKDNVWCELNIRESHEHSENKVRKGTQSGWPNELNVRFPLWKVLVFNHWPCQSNEFKKWYLLPCLAFGITGIVQGAVE